MSATDGKLVFPLFVDKPDKDLAVNEVNTFSRFYDSFLSILDGKVDLDGVKLDRWTCDQLYRSTKGHPRVGVVIDIVFQKRKAGDYDAANGSTEYDKYKKALIDALKSSGEDNDKKKRDEVEREWETFPALSRSTGTEVINQYRNLVTRTDSLKGEVPMRKRADAVLRSLSQSTQDVWSATLTSAQLKDPDVLIQKLTKMCKTVHGDESAPWKGGLAPKKQGDIRAVVKEEIALFVGGGMGLPRKEKPNNTRPPKKSNNSSQPNFKGNPISNSEKKCWRCGRSSCKNPSTCESLKEGNECKCCGRLGHWKPTCRCSKCMAEKNAALPRGNSA